MEDINKEALLLIDKIETHSRMFASCAKSYHGRNGCTHVNITALIVHYDKLCDALDEYEELNDHFAVMMVEKSADLEKLFKPKEEKKK